MARTLTLAERALREITEDAWDAQLFRGPKALAVSLGWTSYHVLRSRGSRAGFPDRTLWRDRVIFAELKSETGKVSDEQGATLDGLALAGAECYVWRPSDLDEIARILCRWNFVNLGLMGRAGGDPIAHHWTPRSMWLPGGRADFLEWMAK